MTLQTLQKILLWEKDPAKIKLIEESIARRMKMPKYAKVVNLNNKVMEKPITKKKEVKKDGKRPA